MELDELDKTFARAFKPGKRSPTARQDPSSFWNEIDDKQLTQYTPEQLQTILAQRSKVLDVAKRANLGEFRLSPLSREPTNTGQPSASDGDTAMGDPFRSIHSSSQRPWLPFLGGECQTKWCHACKPHCLDRSWMSLDGIANGELPLTAIHGLSFILEGERIVSDVKHVLNLGLRPNPALVRVSVYSKSVATEACSGTKLIHLTEHPLYKRQETSSLSRPRQQ